MTDKVVIVGAGHAAGQAIATLKQQKYAGNIVLVGSESHLPYQRPPLSKKFLSGDLSEDRLYVKPESFYDDDNIDIVLDTTICEIDRKAKIVRTTENRTIDYDKLILALGSRARRLPVEGGDLEGVHYLRSIDDVNRIRADIGEQQSIAIIGAGYIGLEVAAVLREAGHNVNVVEMADRVMSRVVSPEISDFYQIEHANKGVHLHLETGVESLQGNGRVTAVKTSTGELIEADVVVIGVGIQPNVELAMDTGLTVDNGIVVDERCLSSDENIYAIGDCTNHPNRIYGRRLRLESVQNALEQAKTAAGNLSGLDSRYDEVPWFWSDQYDLKLQIAGLSDGYDEIVLRGDPAGRTFACLYLKDDRLIATDAINSPRDFMQSKKVIAGQKRVNRARLRDTETALNEAVE